MSNAERKKLQKETPPAGASGSTARRIESLRSMAVYAAHVLADRRGGWDFETSWVRETGDEWIDEEAEKAAKRVAAVVLDVKQQKSKRLTLLNVVHVVQTC